MFPFLDLKIIKIPMYGLCILAGLIIAFIISYFLIRLEKKCFWDFVILSAMAGAFGVLFSKILYILVTYPVKDFFRIFISVIIGKDKSNLFGGFVFYGGIIGGLIGLILGKYIAHCKLSDYIDLFGLLVPLVHSFGRVGCFCAGCCYGIRYDGIFSVKYTNPLSSVPTGVGIFPVQLLESLLVFILFLILLFLYLKGKKNIIFIYLISYGIIRFFTEFLRYDNERGLIFGISISQYIIIFLIIFSIVCLIIKKIKAPAKNNAGAFFLFSKKT